MVITVYFSCVGTELNIAHAFPAYAADIIFSRYRSVVHAVKNISVWISVWMIAAHTADILYACNISAVFNQNDNTHINAEQTADAGFADYSGVVYAVLDNRTVRSADTAYTTITFKIRIAYSNVRNNAVFGCNTEQADKIFCWINV